MRLINVNTYLKAAPGVHLLGKLVLNMFLEIPLLIWNYVYVYIYMKLYIYIKHGYTMVKPWMPLPRFHQRCSKPPGAGGGSLGRA
jgi:hypothetical protein